VYRWQRCSTILLQRQIRLLGAKIIRRGVIRNQATSDGARIAYGSGSRDAPRAQQIWVQQGIVDVTVGSVAYRLKQDDCLAMLLNVPISFHNRSQKLARYIVVIGNERVRATR